MNLKPLLVLSTLTACYLTNAQASQIAIDGNLADWGLHKNGNSADWTPDPSLNLILGETYKVEDQHTAYLNPGFGGQAYDAEAMYVHIADGNLYLALITGLSPNTPNDPLHNSFGPGDFAIDFGQNGSYEFGIQTTGPNQGHVYSNVAWDYGLWDANGSYAPNNPDTQHPTSIKSGTDVAIGQLVYNSIGFKTMGQYYKDTHYVIEAAIPLLAFAGFSGKFDVHWTMNCANDAIWADPVLPSQISEPATLALLIFGLTGLTYKRMQHALVSI